MVMDGNNRSHRAPVLPQGAPGAYRPSGDLGRAVRPVRR